MAILPGHSLGFRKSEGSSPTLMSRKCGQRTFWTRLLRRCGTAVDVKNVWFLLLLHSVNFVYPGKAGASSKMWWSVDPIAAYLGGYSYGMPPTAISHTLVILDRHLIGPSLLPPYVSNFGWMGSRMIWLCGWRHWAILTKMEMAVFPLMSFVTLAESNCSSRAVRYCGWWIARYN